ncbi:hypothetical protein RN001_004240 [Aquatica leii]|uniref:Uncharacterized protein n=1 Tax=Aquatica leii TaxID=1421715 RepID=A0AAN7SA05_9COLE|nr:hypothetical protein RN001_004240 [Aquatica leii]
MGKKLEEYNKEVKEMKEELRKLNEVWKRKFEEMEKKYRKLDARLEKIERSWGKTEKEKRRTNIIIRGMEVKNGKKEQKEQVENWIKKNLNIEKTVVETRKLAERVMLVRMGTFEDKLDVLKQKKRLRGTSIYLDDDMTRREIDIQKKIRYEASKMKGEGKRVKIGFLKVWVEENLIFRLWRFLGTCLMFLFV